VAQRCNVGDEGAKHFATALKQNRTLRDLALGVSGRGGAAATHILTAAVQGPNIGAEAARYLADALKENGTLSMLSLVRAKARDDGGAD
jgi:hypothetical protein